MHSNERIALVLCPDDADPSRWVAGLTIGERLLFSLYYAGIRKVVFTGEGNRPVSERICLEEISAELIPPDSTVWIVTSDLVLNRAILERSEGPPPDHPVRRVQGNVVADVLSRSRDVAAGMSSREDHGVPTFGLRVLDADRARRAHQLLFRSLIKPMDGFVSRHINRKFSLRLTSLLIRTPLTPNQLTVFSIGIGLCSAVAAFYAECAWSLVVAGLLFQTQSMIDGCDGEIARLKFRFSLTGQWLDSVSDDITNYWFCLGLGLGQARVLEWDTLYWVAGLVFVMQHYASILMYQRIFRMNTGDLLAIPNLVTGAEPTGLWGRIRKGIHVATKRDTFVLITALLTAAQFPLVAFGIIAAGTFVIAPSLTLNEIRIRRAIREGRLKMPQS